MVILSLSETSPVTFLTPWGVEDGVYYLGANFLPVQRYKNIDEAIAVCRRDLDVGLMSIVINEADQVRIWSPLPDELVGKNQQAGAANHALAKAS
jgi:hypothetical protein